MDEAAKTCPECNGDGRVECDGDHDCERCDNSGSVFSDRKDDWVECPLCDGPGSLSCSPSCEYNGMDKKYYADCSECGGEGTLSF